MTLTGYSNTNFPTDALLDAGVVYVGSTKIGVTRGAPKFTPNRTFENITFDGKFAPIAGLDRPMHGEPVIAFTMLEMGGAASGNQLAKLEPGGTAVTVSTTTTTTPGVSGTPLVAGGYVTSLRVVWERVGSTVASPLYTAVLFAKALCTKYDIAGQNKGEALIQVEFAGRLDLTSGSPSDPAYVIEQRTTLP